MKKLYQLIKHSEGVEKYLKDYSPEQEPVSSVSGRVSDMVFVGGQGGESFDISQESNGLHFNLEDRTGTFYISRAPFTVHIGDHVVVYGDNLEKDKDYHSEIKGLQILDADQNVLFQYRNGQDLRFN